MAAGAHESPLGLIRWPQGHPPLPRGQAGREGGRGGAWSAFSRNLVASSELAFRVNLGSSVWSGSSGRKRRVLLCHQRHHPLLLLPLSVPSPTMTCAGKSLSPSGRGVSGLGHVRPSVCPSVHPSARASALGWLRHTEASSLICDTWLWVELGPGGHAPRMARVEQGPAVLMGASHVHQGPCGERCPGLGAGTLRGTAPSSEAGLGGRRCGESTNRLPCV